MNIKTANKLVELRKKNNYSQEQVATKLNISRQAISKWERGEASPDLDNLVLLAKLYNVSVDEILNGDQIDTNFDEKNKISEDKNKKLFSLVSNIIFSSTVILIVLAYLLIGFYVKDGWKYWPLFLFITLPSNIFDCIRRKKAGDFLIPLYIAGAYCFIGVFTSLWHPYWALFLIIPLYYGVVKLIENIKSTKK